MYEEGFRWWRMGVAAAIAFVLFGIILLWTLLQLRLQRERGTCSREAEQAEEASQREGTHEQPEQARLG